MSSAAPAAWRSTSNDVIYTADSESTERTSPGMAERDPDREPQGRQGDDLHPAAHDAEFPDGAMGEGIAIDAAGNIYTAEAQLRGITKYVKN